MTETETPVAADEQTPGDIPGLLHFIGAYWAAQGIRVVALLGIADLLKDGPKSHMELAAATGSHADSLYRVLRALSSVGVLHETHSGLFELTPISETLRADVPGSLRAFTIFQMSHNPIWAEFIHTVKTGEVAFDHTYGISLWEWLGEKPQLGTTFNQAMTDMTSLVHECSGPCRHFGGFNSARYRRTNI